MTVTDHDDDDDKKRKQSQAGRKAWRTRFINAGLSDWHATEASGMLEKKCDQRDLCMDYLTENHPSSPMHVLSLPGSRFEMERKLVKIRPDVMFTCIERSTKFIEVCRSVFDNRAPGGKFTVDTPWSLSNERVQLLNINAGELGDHKLTEPLTAIWFDGMGMLNSADFKAFIKSLRKKITQEHDVPTVFTLLQGRDNQDFYKGTPGGISARRVRKLVSMLKSIGLDFEIDKFWAYGSDAGGAVRMINICGRLRRKVVTRKREWNLVSFDNFQVLRTALTDHGLSAYLGCAVSTFKKWTPDRAPDTVAQVEILRVIKVCQGTVLPVPCKAKARIKAKVNKVREEATWTKKNRTPWGKDRHPVTGILIDCEEELAITAMILDAHERGLSETMITAELRVMGIVSPRSRKPLWRPQVVNILKKQAKVACLSN